MLFAEEGIIELTNVGTNLVCRPEGGRPVALTRAGPPPPRRDCCCGEKRLRPERNRDPTVISDRVVAEEPVEMLARISFNIDDTAKEFAECTPSGPDTGVLVAHSLLSAPVLPTPINFFFVRQFKNKSCGFETMSRNDTYAVFTNPSFGAPTTPTGDTSILSERADATNWVLNELTPEM